MPSAKPQQMSTASTKRRSGQLDLSNLGPLQTKGTVGWITYRDTRNGESSGKKSRKRNGHSSAMDRDDSDEEEDEEGDPTLAKMDEDGDVKATKPMPEDNKFSGELADGVNRIKVCYILSPQRPRLLGQNPLTNFLSQLKRAHSAEPERAAKKSPSAGSKTPEQTQNTAAGLPPATLFGPAVEDQAAAVGSPLKRVRPNGSNGDASVAPSLPALGDVLANAEAGQEGASPSQAQPEAKDAAMEEQL
jgi:hypothetical protein